MGEHSTGIASHIRSNKSILAPFEMKVLQWLVERMPPWITPDKLTGIGFGSTVLIFLSYYLSRYQPMFLWLASVGLLFNWFGDSLDGTIARYRNIERPRFGFFIDHTIDAIGQVLIVLGIGLSGYVSMIPALLTLIAYLLLSIHVYLYTYVMGVFELSFYWFGPTEVRLILILFNTILFFVGKYDIQILGTHCSLYDCIFYCASLCMSLFFVLRSWSIARLLSKAENS